MPIFSPSSSTYFHFCPPSFYSAASLKIAFLPQCHCVELITRCRSCYMTPHEVIIYSFLLRSYHLFYYSLWQNGVTGKNRSGKMEWQQRKNYYMLMEKGQCKPEAISFQICVKEVPKGALPYNWMTLHRTFLYTSFKLI